MNPPPDADYIGRGSKCGNPFPIDNSIGQTREVVIQRYAEHVDKTPALRAEMMKLRGRKLLCFCSPRICHGDVIAILCEGLETDPVKAGWLVTEGGMTIAKIKSAYTPFAEIELE